MANSGGIISSPVRQIADVKTVLGESVNTLSGLCTSTKINYWAKYKPVRLTAVAPDRSSDWWKGEASHGSCGFTPMTVGSLADLVNYYSTAGSLNGWVYARPDGSTYPYRLYDFAGYNHNATPFISDFRSQTSATNRSGGTYACWIAIRGNDSSMVNVSDLTLLSTYYFGAYLKRTSGTATRTLYNTYTISEADGSAIEASSSGWTAGTYDVYPFLTNSSHNTFYTIPNVMKGSVEIVTTYVTVVITNFTISNLNVTAYVTIRNTSTSSQTISTNTWKIRPASESETDPDTSYDTSGTIASQTVSASSTKSVTISATMTSYAKNNSPVLYVSFGNGQYKDSAHLSVN